MDRLEDRPLLSKRRLVVYWKVVAGVVVLQPLPSTWVVLNRILPSLPTTTPNIAISFVTSQPYFFNSFLYCPTSPHYNGKKPNPTISDYSSQYHLQHISQNQPASPHILTFLILRHQWYHVVPHPGAESSFGKRMGCHLTLTSGWLQHTPM